MVQIYNQVAIKVFFFGAIGIGTDVNLWSSLFDFIFGVSIKT